MDDAYLRYTILDFAISRQLTKANGFIYQPVLGSPCAYVIRCTYKKFIREVFGKDKVYANSADNYHAMMRFLTDVNIEGLDVMVIDKDILSFTNGVMHLQCGVFETNDEIYNKIRELDDGSVRQVARHHIPFDYLDCPDTPLFDLILEAQFGKEVAEILCALLGRLFFEVNQLDGWQVMPFLCCFGGDLGKVILKIVQKLFADDVVGFLPSKKEKVFGCANLLDKDVVFGMEMQENLSNSLSPSDMNSMVKGDWMTIRRKHLTSTSLTWHAQMIMAGNYNPKESMHFAVFRFDNPIDTPMQGLLTEITSTELPNIFCRLMRSYKAIREKAIENGGFWQAVPELMLQWKFNI